MLTTHKDLARKLVALEKEYDEEFKIVFEAIHELMTPPEKPRRKIGFVAKDIKKLSDVLKKRRKNAPYHHAYQA